MYTYLYIIESKITRYKKIDNYTKIYFMDYIIYRVLIGLSQKLYLM